MELETRLDGVIEKYMDKYLSQSDVEIRLTLKSEMMYSLIDYSKGSICIAELERSFNLTEEDEKIVSGIEDKERMLEFYHDQDTRYLNKS
ncbi:hypothetical protein CL617_01780 [archaeon]|nr:hypothetical protein [archaeon]|tara:strand:+ start:30 stop:299 length:270 start_codon:yes stop_codon:yes gene_type:complete